MKQLLTPFALLAISSLSFGQGTIVLSDGNGVIPSGSSITVTDAADVLTMGLAFDAVLTGGNDMINVRRYETSVLPGTMNYFCWWECYAPSDAGEQPVWEGDDPVEMEDGVEWTGFHAYYRPASQVGTSCFRYVWFSLTGNTDSVWVDICFEATAVGINELTLADARLDIAPNPSNGEVTFRFDDGATRPRQLVLHNALGERVNSVAVTGAQRKISFGEGELAAGVWFASLEAEGRVLTTRRFIISGH